MKFSTKVKMFAASVKTLSPAELKDVVKDAFRKGSKEVSEAQNIINLFFRIYQHGFVGCKAAAAETSDEDIQRGQEALSRILERVAKVMEDSEEDRKVLRSVAEAYFTSATEKTTASIEADTEVVELLRK